VSGLGDLTVEQIRELSKPAEPGPMQLFEKNQELQAANGVLLGQVERLMQENRQWFTELREARHDVTRLERANKVMEQRLRRIGDAAMEGRTVDGL
jgi:hypothetical protein